MSERPGDRERVRELLGRAPRGEYEIVVRDHLGDPVVLRNAPLLNDGTPMPTRFWLVGPAEVRRIGRLESDRGVDRAESEIDPAELAAAHARYAAERDAAIPADHTGPRPMGGVGGTRVGLKCLHAHWAWHLAGGDDPVGRWIERQLATVRVAIDDGRTTLALPDGGRAEVPWGPANLTVRWLAGDDPPRPESLTNALGAVDDFLEDAVREHPALAELARFELEGPAITSLARLEAGSDTVDTVRQLTRDDAEEVFRLVATSAARDRAAEPGLPSDDVEVIVATCCIVLALMRRFRLGVVTLRTGGA